MSLRFVGWNRLVGAMVDETAIARFLNLSRQIGLKHLIAGIRNPPKTGRIYRRRGRRHQASINFRKQEYPARDTGALIRSAKSYKRKRESGFGTNMPYSKWLAGGTRRMKPRRMSEEAAKETQELRRSTLRKFARFRKP